MLSTSCVTGNRWDALTLRDHIGTIIIRTKDMEHACHVCGHINSVGDPCFMDQTHFFIRIPPFNLHEANSQTARSSSTTNIQDEFHPSSQSRSSIRVFCSCGASKYFVSDPQRQGRRCSDTRTRGKPVPSRCLPKDMSFREATMSLRIGKYSPCQMVFVIRKRAH